MTTRKHKIVEWWGAMLVEEHLCVCVSSWNGYNKATEMFCPSIGNIKNTAQDSS